MKKIMLIVSCLLSCHGKLNAKTPINERKQHLKAIIHHIQLLNKKADTIIQQRDRLTAYLKAKQKRYKGES